MTERAKKLLLLYYKQSRKIRRVSGLPPLTFKAKKAGTLKNYRIYGNTETKTRSYSGSAPLSFPIVDGAVSNYRIYGNTVNGESVGDKTANILPLSRTPITETHGDFLCEYDGLGTITLTTDKDNATTDDEFVIPLIQDFTIPVSIGQGGTGCFQINNDTSLSSGSNSIKFYYNDTYCVDGWSFFGVNRTESNYKSMGNRIINAVSVVIDNGESSRKITIKPAFVENVTEQVPFEPYGYKLPITNNSETANIYLDTPLRKIGTYTGTYTDYVDYESQKVIRRVGHIVFTSTSNWVLEQGHNYYYDIPVSSIPTQYIRTNRVSSSYTGIHPDSNESNCFISGTGKINVWLPEIDSLSEFQDWLYEEPFIVEYGIENTEVDVTLPALPAQSSSNSLSVGTAVQPSSVAVDVDEVVSCGDKVTDSQSVNYGKYKIPVTITAGSAETTNIYLDEPLAKSGNNADYIDYMAQKRHNSDGTESSVTLPEISVTAGTNTLTVGTDVQPSSVEIKGRIKAAGGD